MEILQKLSFINDAYDVYNSHTKIMFACGEQSVEDVLWDHRWSVVLYKHKLAWYGYTKEFAMCYRWQGEIPSPGE